MAKIIIEFDIDNAAFEENFESEVNFVLSQARDRINMHMSETLADSNGNRIGEWRIKND